MKREITFAQLAEVLPMAACGIWLNIDGRINYISDNDIWNLILEKYGKYKVDFLKADDAPNADEKQHIVVCIVDPEKAKRWEEKGL